MTHLPEPFHSTVPGLDPARDAAPPAHLSAAVLAARAQPPDGDIPRAPRSRRGRPVVALVAACLVVLAGAGLVARLRAQDEPPVVQVATAVPSVVPSVVPGVIPERRDLTAAQVPQQCPGVTGHSMPAHVPGAGNPSPQAVLDGVDRTWALRTFKARVAWKVVYRSTDTWTVVYLDAANRYLGGATLETFEPGQWVLDETTWCE